MYRRQFILFMLASVLTVPETRAQAQEIPKDKQTKIGKYLTPKQAADVVASERAKVLFVDIRTRGELQFVGVATDIDGHVPFVEMNEFGEWDDKAGRYKLEPNPTFSTSIEKLLARKGLAKTDKIILICRSGDRSSRAANLLADIGFTNVWNQYEGFEGDLDQHRQRGNIGGWRKAGLPWVQD